MSKTAKPRKRKPLNTTKPTMARLTELGYRAQVVEVYLPWAKRRRDFFHFADVLAFKVGEPGVLAVQTTSRDHVTDRVNKILGNDDALAWAAAGNRIEVWGWRKVREGRKTRLEVVVRHVAVESLLAVKPAPESAAKPA